MALSNMEWKIYDRDRRRAELADPNYTPIVVCKRSKNKRAAQDRHIAKRDRARFRSQRKFALAPDPIDWEDDSVAPDPIDDWFEDTSPAEFAAWQDLCMQMLSPSYRGPKVHTYDEYLNKSYLFEPYPDYDDSHDEHYRPRRDLSRLGYRMSFMCR